MKITINGQLFIYIFIHVIFEGHNGLFTGKQFNPLMNPGGSLIGFHIYF